MTELYTSTDPSKAPKEPTLDEMLTAIDDMLSTKVPIGTLHGEVVYLRQSDRTLHFGDISCSVDHQYLQGTKIAEAALRFMGE